MSNALAIAAVTAVLESRFTTLLNANDMAGFDVAVDHPRGDSPNAGVYIKPYRIAPNAALRNMDLPARTADGAQLRKPRFAAELDLLISFVGDPATFDAERLAGLVLTDLHARPVLMPQEIDDFLAGLPGGHVLASADLGEQLERVKLTPLALSLDDLARVWGMCNQPHYCLSIGCQASVILLEADVRTTVPLPVTTRGLHVMPGIAPRVAQLVSSARNQPLVAVGETLIARGAGLRGASTWLRIGGALIEVPDAAARPHAIELPLDPALGLRAGVLALQVVHRVVLGPPADPYRTAAESNALPFALIPTVTPNQPNAIPTADGLSVRLDVVPLPAAGQDATLLLDRIGGGERTESRSFELDGDVVVFAVDPLPAGDYLVRLRVDGAMSIPVLGPGGVYDSPAVSVS